MSPTTINKLVVTYPSGNTTAIVFDDLKQLDREKLNASILKTWQSNFPDKPPIEQCCFVSRTGSSKILGRVEMFGGEFCGNATRSAVWLFTNGKNGSGLIESSGCSQPLSYSVADGIVTLWMPLPTTKQTGKGLAVKFDGITQLVVSTRSTRNLLEKILASGYLRLKEGPAVGVSNYDRLTQRARFSVWVKEVNTIFDETACGSGTAAIGIALAIQNKQNQRLKIIQPSGEQIKTTAYIDSAGNITSSEITGEVSVLYNGKIKLL